MARLTFLRKRPSDERGAILIITALVMMIMLMVAAFATDLGAWYRQAQEQQRAADLGSLNGVQVYESNRRDAFELANVSAWDQITDPADRLALERQLLEDATNSVIGVLNAAGSAVQVTASNPDWPNAVISDPGINPPAESSVEFVTTDGKTVTVIRTVDRTIRVEVSQQGDQYFSSFVTGAPTIERGSTATLSNCGAVCNQQIIIDPPFVGFSGSGSGDGYRPLLYPQREEIWAVNHHRREGDTTGGVPDGEIICMNMRTRTFCSAGGGIHGLADYATHNRPAGEHLQTSGAFAGRLYFVARSWNTDRTGVVCFNTHTAGYCGFTDLWDQTRLNDWPIVNATGPWVYNNQLWVLAQNGEIACVNFNMTTCGMWDSALVGNANVNAIDGNVQGLDGELVGDRIYLLYNNENGTTLFSCFDIGDRNGAGKDCGWGAPASSTNLGTRSDSRFAFMKRNTGGTAIGFCALTVQAPLRHDCVNMSGVPSADIPGFDTGLASIANSWGGDPITTNDRTRTFFAGGNSNNTGCWDWTTASACGIIDHWSAQFNPAGSTRPYGYAQLTENCIVGLGHDSVYFSFQPGNLDPCVETTASANLLPCTCVGGEDIWGTVILPQSLLSQVDSIRATVTGVGPAGQPNYTYIDDVDVLPLGGELDLTMVPSTVSVLTLDLVMNVKLDMNGNPLWTDPIPVDIQLVVQPTLSG